MDGAPPQHWDRSKWITVFSSHSPTIREVTECLGLGLSPSASITNRGIPKFDAPEFKKLSAEVTRLSKELPQEREALLDFAADPQSLEKELDQLLESLGPAIWGRDADRTRLVTPDPTKKTYCRDLFYEDPNDRNVLKVHLQRWIVIKACYYIRNRKLKKHSTGDEYETIADIDAGSPAQKPELVVRLPITFPQLSRALNPQQSPTATPQDTPPDPARSTPTEGSEPLLNLRKRKSSAFLSHSDEEENASASSAAKKRPYQTLPIQRKSPRKSISAGRLSIENIPPSPSPSNLQPSAGAAAASVSEAGRPLLSPLSSNALNGAPRPANASSFATTVNTPNGLANASHGAFAPVNAPIVAATNAPPSTAAANAPNASAIAPVNTFAPVNVPIPSANASPSTFAPVNPPSGFTAVNAPGSSNVPIAPNPRGYSSPYSAQNAQHAPDSHHAPNGHSGMVSHTPPIAQREPSPQKTLNANQGLDIQPAPNAQSTNTPPIAPNGPSAPSVQPSFHNHSIPAPGVANIQPKFHPHYAPPNGAGVIAAPVLPSNAPVRHNFNGHPPESRTTSRAVSPTDTTLLQCELLGLLMRFFFPRDASRLDEAVLHQNLEYIWSRNEGQFRRTMGHFYELQAKILFAWMEERRKMGQLQYAMEAQPGVRSPEMVDRLLAMNDLRVMRLKWKALSTQDGNQTLSPEDLLCRTFATMTKTEGTEHLFKDGLERMNENVFSFLRSEDMKIKMDKR